MRLGPVGERPHVRTHGEGNARRQLPLELADLVVVQGPLSIGVRRSRLGEEVEHGERRNGRNILRLHDPHGLLAQLGRVVDGGHSGACGIERTGLAHRMDRDARSQPSRLLDRTLQFGLAVLVASLQLAGHQRVRSGLVDLREIRALLVCSRMTSINSCALLA